MSKLILMAIFTFPLSCLALKKAIPHQFLSEVSTTTDKETQRYFYHKMKISNTNLKTIIKKLNQFSFLMNNFSGNKIKIEIVPSKFIIKSFYETIQNTLKNNHITYSSSMKWNNYLKAMIYPYLKNYDLLQSNEFNIRFIKKINNNQIISSTLSFNQKELTKISRNIDTIALTAKIGKIRIAPYFHLSKELINKNPLLDLRKISSQYFKEHMISVDLHSPWWIERKDKHTYFNIFIAKSREKNSSHLIVESLELSQFDHLDSKFAKEFKNIIKKDFERLLTILI